MSVTQVNITVSPGHTLSADDVSVTVIKTTLDYSHFTVIHKIVDIPANIPGKEQQNHNDLYKPGHGKH